MSNEENVNNSLKKYNSKLKDDLAKDFSNIQESLNNTNLTSNSESVKNEKKIQNNIDGLFSKWKQDWDKSHNILVEKRQERQVKNQKLREIRKQRRLEQQQKVNQKVEQFFQQQQELFANKINEIQTKNEEIKENAKNKREDRKNNLIERQQTRQDQIKKRKEEQKSHIEERKEKERQFRQESKQLLEENWEKFVKRQQSVPEGFYDFKIGCGGRGILLFWLG